MKMEKIVISSSCKPSFLFWAVLVLHFLLKAFSNPEGDALNILKRNLKDPNNVLQDWDATLPNPCTWFHVTCNQHNSVIAVDLGNQDLSGTLVSNLGHLSNLQYLELYNNSITGKIPVELGNLANLVSLDLYLNNISGTIPNTFGKLQKLRFLRLNDNTLSGSIPVSLTNVSTLQVLDLSNNNLEGNVPVNGSFSLFTFVNYQNNPHLKLPKIIPAPPFPPSPASSGSSNTGAIAGGVAAGVTLLFAAPAIALACWRKRKPRDQFFDVPAEAEEHPEVHLGLLKKFSLRELLVATDNFSEKNILGEGGFAKVYKGRLADGTLVAVKRIYKEHILHMELDFQREVEMISMAVHRNIIRLRGFCMTSTERLLVYPYMANGSLLSCLRERNDSEPLLEWPMRKNIALGSAMGLAYLHDHCDPKIIHCDVKPANIFLDEKFEAVIGDFGIAKLMDYKDTHVSTIIRGTIFYMAPEYAMHGNCSEKNDVYGYGMTLLELIAGQRIYDANDDDDNIWLPKRLKGLFKDKKLETLVDAELKGNYDVDEAEQLIQVALLCIQFSAMKRPKMSEVVRMLEGDDGLAKKWEQWQKEETNRQEFNNDDDMHHHNANWIVLDSTEHNQPEELSGPR